MSELTDILIQALNGNAALALVLIGLVAANYLQTRYFDRRLSSLQDRLQPIEKRVRRTESYLIHGQDDRLPDGGERPEDRIEGDNDGRE